MRSGVGEVKCEGGEGRPRGALLKPMAETLDSGRGELHVGEIELGEAGRYEGRRVGSGDGGTWDRKRHQGGEEHSKRLFLVNGKSDEVEFLDAGEGHEFTVVQVRIIIILQLLPLLVDALRKRLEVIFLDKIFNRAKLHCLRPSSQCEILEEAQRHEESLSQGRMSGTGN